MPRKKGWTCQRSADRQKCKHHNPSRARKCQKCGKARPARTRAAHFGALDLTYETYAAINGGEFCGICGRLPSSKRRLDRDHDHQTGQARGLLCARCNRALPSWMGREWLLAAVAYLRRVEDRQSTAMQGNTTG